jgi:hypothetical protein
MGPAGLIDSRTSLTDGMDHLVIDVGTQIDEAEAAYRSLGFNLSARGRHTIGSVNHLAVFPGHYLELLGTGESGSSGRADTAGFPEGLNGLVFRSSDANSLYTGLLARDVPAQPPVTFSRPVSVDGKKSDATFDVVRLAPGSANFGRVYFCHHKTPELVWTADGEKHPNGVTGISRIRVATEDAERSIALLRSILGRGSVISEKSGSLSIRGGDLTLDFISPIDADADLADLWANASGRQDYMAILTLVTSSLDQAAQVLQRGRVPGVAFQSQRILVPPRAAFNVGLEFVAG